LYRRGQVFNFRYKDKDGVWREKSTGESEPQDALAFKKKWDEDAANDQLPGDRAKWTVAQACTRWVETHVLKSVKAKSNERSYLRRLISILGDKKLDAITLDDLKSYQAKRSETVAARPINIELGILVKVLKEENLWKRSLSEHYRRLKEPEGEIGRALTIEELTRLERTAAMRDAWMVACNAELLAAKTGLRGGEIKKLRLGMVDLENRRLRVCREITKTDAGARTVELNSPAMFPVAKLYGRAQRLGATSPDHYLLPADLSKHTKSQDPLRGKYGFDPCQHQISWDAAWRNLRKEAGLGKLRFHDLRHSFINADGRTRRPSAGRGRYGRPHVNHHGALLHRNSPGFQPRSQLCGYFCGCSAGPVG
jgi:integrase